MSLFGRVRKLGRLDKEIDEELRFHLEEKERRLIADGLTPAEASRQARKAFGSQAAVREYARDAWIFRWADDLWRDLRFAARGLRRSPGFTVVAVLTLALGIGACTTIFTFVNALLLRELPVRNPEELVWFGVEDPQAGWLSAHSYRLYEMLNEGNGPLEGFAAVSPTFSGVTINDTTVLISVHLVTGEYFRLLGASPALGRLLDATDIEGINGPVAVLRYGAWGDRFGSDPSIVGRTITLGGAPFRVVGVAQPGFLGTDVVRPADLWSTIDQAAVLRAREDWRAAGINWLLIFGRCGRETSIEQAQAYASTVYDRFREVRLSEANSERREEIEQHFASQTIGLRTVSATGPRARESYIQRLTPLAAAVGLVLLLCCANVANLLLGRAFKRRRELGVRLATGASRWRVVRQLLTEGLLLASAGSVVGVCLAVVASRYLLRQTGIVWAPDLNVSPDPTVLFFTAGVSALCVILAALLPALTASRLPLSAALRGLHGDAQRTLGSRGVLMAAQFALCLPLLVGVGLLIRTVDNLFSQDVGFERAQRLHATVGLYASGFNNERGLAFLNDLLTDLQAQPSFDDVGFSMFGTLGSSFGTNSMPIPTPDGGKRQISTSFSYLSEGFLETMGVPLLAGRDFRASDIEGAPRVAIVNQAFAKELEVANPIGMRLDETEIVGLVPDAKDHELREPPPPQIFYPFRQSLHGFPIMQIYVRSDMSVEPFTQIMREHVSRLDATVLVDGFSTLDDLIENRMQEERMTSSLLSGFGVLALLITAIGLYSVIAFDVSRRTQEVGVRIALGAQKSDIQAMVFRRGAPWVLGGCALGLAAAAVVARLLEAKLFGVAALDPLTFTLAAAFLLLCAAAANYFPARRAASVEPMTALRHD